MSSSSYSSNPLSLGKFGELLFVRQTPMLQAETHPSILSDLSGRFNAWRERRAAAAELAGLSDRQLADIGVSRSRISQVVSDKR
jgi:uncharacterized protein YjiS (DUF1127 family)